MDDKWHYVVLAINIVSATINIIIGIFCGITLISFITAWACFIVLNALLCFCNLAHNNWRRYNNAKIKILTRVIDLKQEEINELRVKYEMGKEK